MKTVLSIIGTRPEAIKMAPVIKELDQKESAFRSIVCSTGQHRQMLDQVLSLFQIKPDLDLELMQANQTLSQLTAGLLTGIDRAVVELQPDWILAQGDTTSAMVAALVAFYHRIPFGHVEAGLRTGNRYHPFPEEINRKLADAVAMALFAPTERARKALLAEGIAAESIRVTGNTVVDALLDIAGRPYDWNSGPLAFIPKDAKIILVTAHRRESFGERFRQMCLALRDLASEFRNENYHLVYPVHLNPNVQEPVKEILAGLENLHLIEPIDYVSLVHLLKRSVLVLTDSGGIQEEAPSFQVPVLVMRETTERPEGVEAGIARLVGTERAQIVKEARALLHDPSALASMRMNSNPYGDGKAGARIVAALGETTWG
jgi:UDP-N-acetylglucosamine 2-epimerase (non-hydrolysing)